tara:strand:- start:235 stop:426 length:192 start_codon:yes stop_codon:yes gene_type:complete
VEKLLKYLRIKVVNILYKRRLFDTIVLAFLYSNSTEYKKSIELNNLEILSEFKNNDVNKWVIF